MPRLGSERSLTSISRPSAVVLLSLLFLCSPVASQECVTEAPRQSGELSRFLNDEGVALLGAAWRPAWGRTVGSILPRDERRPDPERRAEHLRIWSAVATSAELAELEASLMAFRTGVEVDDAVSFFVSEGDSLRVFQVEELAECSPSMLNGSELAQELRRRAQELRPRRRRETGVSLFVDRKGNVTDWRLRATSGSSEIDRAAMEVARTARFEVARVEGIPVGVWVSFPITFQVR